MRLRIVSSVSPSPPTDRVTSSHASGSSERYAAATCAAPSLCSNQLPGRLARSAISFGRALSAALAAASLAAFFASASARMYSSCFSTHALSRSAASASRASFSASAAASRRDAVIAASADGGAKLVRKFRSERSAVAEELFKGGIGAAHVNRCLRPALRDRLGGTRERLAAARRRCSSDEQPSEKEGQIERHGQYTPSSGDKGK
mmetsp:Transcript_6870/g.20285  ORF Transcript_6870/g.20285 Transcript_6870/m.20285 type:complete len:205 (-) Transcript_6870:181-795(-)